MRWRRLLARADRIDRVIVQVATVAAGVYFTSIVGSLFLAGSWIGWQRAVAPLAVLAIGAVSLALDKPQPIAQLLVGMAGLVFTMLTQPVDVPGDPVLGLLSMAVVGSLLVKRHRMAYVVAAAALVGYAAFSWQAATTDEADRLIAGSSAAVTTLITAALIVWIRGQSERRGERLERLVKAKDEFVATVSHELRTPLATVLGLSLEVRERFDDFDREELLELLDLISRESEDLSHIVDDLLVVGRQRGAGSISVEPEPLDLAATIEPTMHRHPEVAMQLDTTGRCYVYADAGRLRQIVRNLIGNAVRYGGGTIRVLLRIEPEHAYLEIRDDGEPIPVAERALMFMPYHRVKSVNGAPGSVGLGLTVSRQLARLMDGDVDYYHDGQESVFSLRLPRYVPAMDALPTPADPVVA